MSDMNDDMLADAIGQLLADAATPAVVRAIEAGGAWAPLWDAIERSGFCDAAVAEANGGAGLGLSDLFGLFEACGRHALPLPLAQTIAARGVLSAAGHGVPAGPIALASVGAADAEVPVVYGAVAPWVLLAASDGLRLLEVTRALRMPTCDGSVDARLRWSAETLADPTARVASDVDLRALEACILAAQLSGAMGEVFARTLAYANDRSQFGRSIGKFQAIQHQLSVMAEQTEAGRMAARMACATTARTPAPLQAAMAKARASEAAVEVGAIAHAVHGAIGITAEFDLQLLTRRLLAWRLAAGSASYWNARIGAALLQSPHAGIAEFVRLELSAA